MTVDVAVVGVVVDTVFAGIAVVVVLLLYLLAANSLFAVTNASLLSLGGVSNSRYFE